MKPFRKNLAIAIDGGGIRGVIAVKALSMLEESMGKPVKDTVRLTAGTSTGSIIAAGIAAGLSASNLFELYIRLGETIFKKSLRTIFWPLTKYRYPHEPLADALRKFVGDGKMGNFWTQKPPIDVVITTFDLLDNKACFIKPWKEEYKGWSLITAILASSSVPTYFPVVEGRYVDGGIGAYANPCFLAAYEAQYCLKWDPEETTLISLGTGRTPNSIKPGEPEQFSSWGWLEPILGAFLSSADDQQVHLVETFFKKLDFRRYQVDMKEFIAMDDVTQMDRLIAYGEEMGKMILSDQDDSAMGVKPERIQHR